MTHPPHDERTPRMSTYVFGYGSLVSPASAARSLGRELTIDGLPSALLTGHRRDWGIGVPVEFDDGFRTVATFLDVQPREGSAVRGALLRVTDDELRILAAREAQYDAVDVTASIETDAPLDLPVVAFSGRAEHRAAGDRVLPRRYLDLVTGAVADRGRAFADEFWATTADPADPIRDGSYRFQDGAQEAAARPT